MLTKAEIQRVRSLREKKGRQEHGMFAVEGEKSVGELLASRHPVAAIYATAEWIGRRAPACPVPVTRVSARDMERMSGLPSPPPVLATVPIAGEPFDPDTLNRGFTLAMDDVRDPGNAGTILRIAHWFGFDRVICSQASVDRHNPKVVAASMGSIFHIPFWEVPLAEVLGRTKATVLGCDLGGTNVHELPPCPCAVVVIGNEGRGLSTAVREHVGHLVTIPRIGGAESLNAAVAAAVICDNLTRINGRGPH